MKKGDVVVGLPEASKRYLITVQDTEWIVIATHEEGKIISLIKPTSREKYLRYQKKYDKEEASLNNELPLSMSYSIGCIIYDVESKYFKVVNSFFGTPPKNNEQALGFLNND